MTLQARLSTAAQLSWTVLASMFASLELAQRCGAERADALIICEAAGALVTLVMALVCARKTRTLVVLELMATCGVTLAWLVYVLMQNGLLRDPSAPEVRLVLLWPAVVWAIGTLGASWAFVGIYGPWRLPMWLAWRLLARPVGHAQTGAATSPSASGSTLATVTRIAGVGVCLGIWLVLVSLGILGGFEGDLTRKIMGASAHVTVQRADTQPFAITAAQQGTLASTSGVAAVAPLLSQEVAIASTVNYAGAQLWGIERNEQSARALPVLAELAAASAPNFSVCAPLCPVIVGGELAQSLVVGLGDSVRLISPSEVTLTPLGPVPKSLGLTVVGIVRSHLLDFDSRTVLVARKVAADFLGVSPAESSELAVALSAPASASELAPRIAADAQGLLGDTTLTATSWQQRNQTLFRALALERIVAAVVLAFILLVAAFAVVNTMTMHVFERQSEVAMLRAMGASDALIVRTFVLQGMAIGTLGCAAGAGLGLVTTALLGRFRFGIPDEVYYIDALPVELSAADVAWVVMAGLVMLWDFSVWPSLKAAALHPVEGLRDC